MTGLGTVVNAAAIIAGGTAGSLLGSALPVRLKETIMQALGLSIVIIGMSGALQGMYRVTSAGTLDREYIMLMIFSLVAGAVTGGLLNIEERLEKGGLWIQNRYFKNSGNFADGFITASLAFCVGAMAIVGALEDGLTGNTSTLFAKSVLDCMISIIFAATLGIGVAFSAIPVFIYQGAITLAAGFVKPLLTETVISQTSLAGSILIMAIGFNLLEFKRIKVGNLLPAIFIPCIWYAVTLLFK